ncbi:U3 small nucleolar RNA-associated protein 14 homolog A-like [Ornithodoros turicata]|uniref:U3 small nucleolar RNA-associated protein 14 homolog A-like n=1 Tax=Ornithodoros turicata TaxID=34597 RepID=UPI00313A30B9
MAASTFLDVLSKSSTQLEDEFLSGSDNEDEQSDEDDFHHTKLLDAIRSLGGKKRVTQRTEPSQTVSEYNLSQAEKEKVPPWQLLMNLKDSTEAHRQTKNQMRSMSRNADVMPLPLPKPQQERIERQVAYGKVEREVSMWEPIVKKNRLAEQMVFPLTQPDLRMQPTEKFVQRFKPKTTLELEVEKLLKGSDHVLHDNAELTPAEERALLAMSVEEAQERHNELKKMRALLSYQEMKARRQNKIKSKKYHRILKKEKLKNQMKEFEELKEKDPELALQKLQELEKQRILERVSLRHKATGKWAKQQMLRSKYNQESREALLKQLELSRQLTRKVNVAESEDEEEEDSVPEKSTVPSEPSGLESTFFTSSNPWLKNLHTSVNVDGDGRDGTPSVPTQGDEDLREGTNEVDDVASTEVGKDTGKVAKTDTRNIEVVDKPHGEDVSSEADALRTSASDTKEGGQLLEATGKHDSNTDEELRKRNVKKTGGKRRVTEEVSEPSGVRPADPASSKSAGNTKRKMTGRQREQNGQKGKPEESLNSKSRKKARKKSAAKKVKGFCEGTADIDDLFDKLQDKNTKKVASDHPVEDKESDDEQQSRAVTETGAESQVNVEPMLDESLTRKRTLEDLEDDAVEVVEQESASPVQQPAKSDDQKEKKHKNVEVDPTKFMDVTPTALKSKGLDLQGPGDEVLDDDEEEDQAVTISEAFADDDVISAFQEEKEAQVKKDMPVGVDNFLPGWGSWAGAGIRPDRRKQKRFFQKPPPGAPRKDHDLGHVIINERKDEKVAAHQVSKLPYPFNNVSQFEAVISHPIGNTWNTEMAFRDLTQPRVITRQGAIIEPIEASNTLLKKKLRARKGLPQADGRKAQKNIAQRKKK